MLIALTGLPGTGKTTIARLLAERLGAVHLRIDTIERALVASGSVNDVGAAGYVVAYGVAADNLNRGLSVVADCVHPVAASRQQWAAVATGAGHRCLLVHVVCSDAVEHRRRVATRSNDIAGHVPPSWDAVRSMRFEPVPAEALLVDTAQLDPRRAADVVLERVGAAGAAVPAGSAPGRPLRPPPPTSGRGRPG